MNTTNQVSMNTCHFVMVQETYDNHENGILVGQSSLSKPAFKCFAYDTFPKCSMNPLHNGMQHIYFELVYVGY
jgi:hypothetical protein